MSAPLQPSDAARRGGLARILALIAGNYGERAKRTPAENDAFLAVLDLVLAPWSVDQIAEAVLEHVASSPHPPVAADLRARLERWTLGLPDPDEAVRRIVECARARGDAWREARATLSFEEADIEEQYRAVLREACAESGTAIRAQIRDAFRQAVQRRLELERSPLGVFPVMAAGAGVDRLVAPSAARRALGATS